jgi:hypothetical protein
MEKPKSIVHVIFSESEPILHIYMYICLSVGHSFPPTQFGGILLQPTTWQANKPSICVL